MNYVTIFRFSFQFPIRICIEGCFPPENRPNSVDTSTDDFLQQICVVQIGNSVFEADSSINDGFVRNIRTAAKESGRWYLVSCSHHSSMLIAPNGIVVKRLYDGVGILVIE